MNKRKEATGATCTRVDRGCQQVAGSPRIDFLRIYPGSESLGWFTQAARRDRSRERKLVEHQGGCTTGTDDENSDDKRRYNRYRQYNEISPLDLRREKDFEWPVPFLHLLNIATKEGCHLHCDSSTRLSLSLISISIAREKWQNGVGAYSKLVSSCNETYIIKEHHRSGMS